MSVPDFQSITLPALEYLATVGVVTTPAVVAEMNLHFHLSEEDKKALLPSGTQRVIENRASWALFYLAKAGLVDRPSRGKYSISELGKKVLARKPPKIDIKFLDQFESFRAFRAITKRTQGSPSITTETKEITNPAEDLERSYAELKASVLDELLKAIRRVDPTEFEKLVITLLRKMGYGVPGLNSVVHKGKTGDGGIDGEISQDPLGLEMIYIQAKRYNEDTSVGRPALQQFVGSLNERKAKKGIFITTSQFSNEAREFTDRVDVKIVLIDGVRFAELMYDHNLGVATQQSFHIKKVDSDFFESE